MKTSMKTYEVVALIGAALSLQIPAEAFARGVNVDINLSAPVVVPAPPAPPQYLPAEPYNQPPIPQANPVPAYPPPGTPPPATAVPPAPQYAPPQYAKPAPLPAPEFVYLPQYGFYASVGYPYDIIFTGEDYYLYYRGYWYQGPFYNGPWIVMEPRLLPRFLRRHRWEEIRYYRDREYGIYVRDRGHYRGRLHRPEFRGEFRFSR